MLQKALAEAENEEEITVENTQEKKLGLIAILVQEELMDDFALRSRIMTYANSSQERIPHSKSLVIEVPREASTFRIASLLEKLYFEGVDSDAIDNNPLNNDQQKEEDNQLIGIVIIGDVPLPVVHENEGLAAPSLYPYTDFYRKKYLYNHESDRFEPNDQVNTPTPEIWHGVIRPPSRDPDEAQAELIDYFDKNYEYSIGNPEYSDFEQRVFYANFPEMEKQMNFMDYKNYGRYVDYMEEIAMRRFNKHLLKEIIGEVSTDLGSPESPIIDDESIAQMYDVNTETLIKKYAVNLAETLRIYRSGINEVIEKTGRWNADQVDSPESLIAIRDEYAKLEIKEKQLILEDEVDDFIQNHVDTASRQEAIVTLAQLNIKTEINDQDIDNRTFHFDAYFDGQPASQVTHASQCGIKVGQAKDVNQSVLENNSVLVEANRMYNPNTLIKPPSDDDDWELENTHAYQKYGGCVFNNSFIIAETGSHPDKCIPELAEESIFDILGSKEVETNEANHLSSPCDVTNIDFRLPAPPVPDPTPLFPFPQAPDYTSAYKDEAAVGMFGTKFINQSLEDILNQAYIDLRGTNPNATIIEKGSYVVQKLISSGQEYVYTPEEDIVIRLKVNTNTKNVDTIYSHVEPTNETIKAIKHIPTPVGTFPQVTTPSTPSDGIRFISFAQNGIKKTYEYLNLFRINGQNTQATTNNLLKKLSQKQTELNHLTNTQGELFQEFLEQYYHLTEPITWSSSSIDQKLASIILKYTDRDSWLPTPTPSDKNKDGVLDPQNAPVRKPDGYEILHLVAEGDAQGYQFGLNRAMMARAPGGQGEEESIVSSSAELSDDNTNADGESGNVDAENNALCGDSSGVEIWEWFDAVQCWIDNEILPAQELFSVSQMCSNAPLMSETEETSEDPFDAALADAEQFEVEMKRKSLIPGQEASIKLSASNAEGNPILGYIDKPFRFEFSSPNVGQTASNEVYIFTGERDLRFTAENTGSTSATITMVEPSPEVETGSIFGTNNEPTAEEPKTRNFNIDVYDAIHIDWQAQEAIKNGRSIFTIDISLKTPDGNPITNINDTIVLAPLKPADGGFENEGKVELKNGQGSIHFMPTPGKKSVALVSKDQYIGINDQPFTIYPTAASASQILLRAPAYMPIGKTSELEVIAADSYSLAARDFSKTISVRLDDKSQEYASLENQEVTMNQGKGTLNIKAGKESADITLIAECEDLKKAVITIPLLARVDSEEWEQSYPQTLFASFVGFPAGDVTQENYFGGTHLFNGKTEAVYSFMTTPTPEASLNMTPNHVITGGNINQTVLVSFPQNSLLLQAFDRKEMQTLFSKKTTLNFDTVKAFDGQSPRVGELLIDVLDENYFTTKIGDTYQLKNLNNQIIASFKNNRILIQDSDFKWVYRTDPEFDAIELLLTDDVTNAARIILSLKPETLKAENFEEINPNLEWQTIYGGKSTNDPTGLSFFAFDAEVPEEKRAEFYGFEGQEKYLSLFASGTNVGEAVKYNMPSNAILLGDPTISLGTKSTSSLNYNKAIGEQIFQDPEGQQIVSINQFNFNNDGYQDIALLMKDGRVRLLEGGATEPPYIDKGNLGFLVDGGTALETFDFNNDHYEDLLVATDEGRLGILHNDKEVITRTDQKINVGTKIYQLLRADMDQDGYDDLVILDSRGDIYIFYYDPTAEAFPEDGMWIGNYGFSLKKGVNLNTDLDIRYTGLPEPSEPTASISPRLSKASLEDYEGGGTIESNQALNYINQLYAENEVAAKDPAAAAASDSSIPKLPWPEGNETESYFAPIESVGGLNVIKTVSNKTRPNAKNVDLEETLTYTLEINSSVTLNEVVLADTIPDALTLDPNSITCVQGGCQQMDHSQNSIRLFFSNLKLNPGQKTIITYDVLISHTPKAGISLQTISEPNENLNNPNSIVDAYPDILVSPPYNNTGKLLIHYSTGTRTYALTQSNDPEPTPADNTQNEIDAMMDQLAAYANGDYSAEYPPESFKLGSSQQAALDEVMGSNECFEDVDDLASGISCVEEGLDKIGNSIADFQCIGGGCFPMPYNRAFLVPSDNFPLPVFAFPTTLPTAVGPVPFIWPGSIIGAASITGPIMSQLRFYLAPTLTGGIGMAMCWGPYPQVPTVPPPVFPVPYPPPVGNCLVTALPADGIYGDLCSSIGDTINKTMQNLAAGVNKVQTNVASTADNIPGAKIDTTNQGQSAGGLEVSLAINLGNSQKFEPPAQGFSNTHIPTMDSIGGIISGWMDRQSLEIENKLLTLPTLSVYWPDIKSLFTLDWDKTEKRYKAWQNVMANSYSASQEAHTKILEGQNSNLGGSQALQSMDAIETQASIYNLNALEGLYDVASSLPAIKITEKPIQFDIPWLSAAEIQTWITQANNWVIYYEREYNRVKDKWEAISCQEQPEGTNASEITNNAINCMGKQIADAFQVSFDPMIQSVKDNIEVLQAWMNFPKQLATFKAALAEYVESIACYLDVVAQMMGGWMVTLKQQMVSWAELILTIIEIVKNIEALFDVFTSFDESCDICTNERYANFGWWMLLGLVLPDLPVIQFPKIPDIVLDMSNMDAMIDIELPVLELRTKSIPLPPLPYITLPDFPTLNILLQLPPLPVLPGPPGLPELPALPPIPTINLPTLPPPPKLPDVSQAFEAIIPLIEKVLEVWCIMKKSFAPVPEMMLNDQITLLTNRPSYLIPLDIMKVELPKIAPYDLGFNELRIETIIYLGLRVNIVAKPIEEWVSDVNEVSDNWVEMLNEHYEKYVIEMEQKTQAWIDEQDESIKEWVAEAEQDLQKSAQGIIDDTVAVIGNPMEEAEEWLTNKTEEWEKWANDHMIEIDYEDYYTAVQNTYEKARKSSEVLKIWLEAHNDFLSGLVLPIIELVSQEDWGENTQEALDLITEKLNESEEKGPKVLDRLYMCLKYYKDCREHESKYFGEPQANLNLTPSATREEKLIAQKAQTPATEISEEEYARQILETPQGQEIKSLLTEIADNLEAVNDREPVDYTVLKEAFNVPDYIPSMDETALDRIKKMRQELLEHSDHLLAEAESLRHMTDLNAIAGIAPQTDTPYQLAASPMMPTGPTPITVTETLQNGSGMDKIETNDTSDQIANLKEKIKREAAQNSGQTQETTNSTGGCNAAFCLPDPITESPISVIPFVDLLASSETLFMPNGHLVYSDGIGLYLKRDLTIDDSDSNTNSGHPGSFGFEEMNQLLQSSTPPKEAVNMLQSTFTENGASTFTWRPTTHPKVYGYGIELERSILGFEASEKNNHLADTKIILLPPNEAGFEPEVTANGQKISYGTLVTSLTDAAVAAKKFGVNPRNIVTGATDIRFPSISNALIKVNENKAVYFDRLDGSSYSLNMENGYYHIKMTWFDEYADTATYNQNEILAPQIYASNSEPIDVSQKNTHYTPIFKEKNTEASEFFVDLGNSYQYYWYLNPVSNPEPWVGDSFTLTAQNQSKNTEIRLLATQDIEDEHFERFEKKFSIESYVPSIELNQEQLNQGVIAGSMSPIEQADDDDLSDIPFSVFRKRQGTWKNLGILHDENKTATTPPLGNHQSYYSVDSHGSYHIEGFDIIDPSPILLNDHAGDTVAEIDPNTGKIQLFDANFDFKAVSGGTDTPTHIAIFKTETEEILGNVYYVANATPEVTIQNNALNVNEVADEGITIGDVNSSDHIIAAVLPNEAPSFPGGAAIFDETAQENIALIDKDGTVRMMKAGYKLIIKNKNTADAHYIFRIVNEDSQPVFDIFIQADFENLQVDASTNMNSLNTQIGLLPHQNTAYAQTSDTAPVPEFQTENDEITQLDGSPFPDLSETHPYFNQILELYKSRVISGYEDGSFKPDQKLTRAEFVKIALGVSNCIDCTTPNEAIKEKYGQHPFPDISLPAWYYYCIAIAKELGMVTGYGDGYFRPDRNISRAEAAAVLLRQSNIELMEAPEGIYKDVPDYAWYVDHVHTAVEIGLIQESFGFVNPDEEITRGEFAFMAAGVKDISSCRLVDTDQDGTPDWWEMTHNTDLFVADPERNCPCYENPWPNDTDGDGIRDICDLDIDNDGILNPLCFLTNTGEIDPEKLSEGATTLGEAIDNCIFTPNEDQADEDNNGVGNVCDLSQEVIVCQCTDNPQPK